MGVFSDRELAIGVWLIAFVGYVLYSKNLRPHIALVIRSFCSIYIVIPILGLGIWVTLLSCLLIEIELWNSGQYKNVALWFVVVGIYSLFQVTDSGKGGKYFKDTAADLVKATTLLEFVVAFYSFSFWFELVSVPIVTALFLMSAIAKKNEEHQLVAHILDKFIVGIGLCIIAYVGHLILTKPGEFFSEGTAYDFFVPLVLTLFIFPYLFLVMLYSEYERSFRRLHFILKDNELESYARKKSLFAFNFHLSHLKRWERYLRLQDASSKLDVDNSIERIQFLLRRDKKNIPVSYSQGWSHYEARRYLSGHGLMTTYYDHSFHGRWTASSEQLKLGDSIFCNKLTYHIDGDENSVQCLTLVLNVDDTSLLEAGIDEFKVVGDALVEAAVSSDKELSIKIDETKEVKEGENQTYTTELEGRQIMIQKLARDYRNAIELRLSIASDKESFKYIDSM